MLRPIDGGTQRHQVVGDAAGGVGVHHEDGGDLVRHIGAEHRFDFGRIDRQSFDPWRANYAATHCLGLHGPGFREMAGARHQHCLAWRDEIGDDRFPCAMPIGGVKVDVGRLGLQQPLQPDFAGSDAAVEPRVGQVHRLPAHGV